MRNNIAGQQYLTGLVCGVAEGFNAGALCSLPLSVRCQVIPRVFRCWTVVLELFSLPFALRRFSFTFTMPTTRNTNNSLQTAPVLPPTPSDAASRPQAPEASNSDARISQAMASFIARAEQTLRRHRSPSHCPAPRWFLAWQVLPFRPLCLWRVGVQEDCCIKVGHFSLCLWLCPLLCRPF